MTTQTRVTYTTYGSVRGCCGHRHQTKEAAERCLQGGYSDRAIVLVGDDGYLYHDMGQFAAEDGDHWVKRSSGTGATIKD